MVKNMGTVDRVVRIAVALVIAYLYYTGRVNGTLGYVLLAVAIAALFLPSVVGSCPGYILLGISTRKRSGGDHAP